MFSLEVDRQIYKDAFSDMEKEMLQAVDKLQNKSGNVNCLGWFDLPEKTSEMLLQDISRTANYLRDNSRCVVVIGIGGSYLGARAVISALKDNVFEGKNTQPDIIYVGHHLSEDYYCSLLEYLNTVDYSIIVISKSGTTVEPAVAFRLLRHHCEQKYGVEKANKRIVCITDEKKGSLRSIADQSAYVTYSIPDDTGGRFSVLSPVGLLPIAVAGLDIRALLNGAKSMRLHLLESSANIASRYALCRNYLLKQGYNIEVLSSFNPCLYFMIEWWKQLFGESEGKDRKGIFPAGMIYTTDLHSMGQYMQEGQRIFFETFLSVAKTNNPCKVPYDKDNLDNLNFLAGKRIADINEAAQQATILAHQQGDAPIMQITIDALDEENLGRLIYFFEYACAVSADILGVNPFDQPGVELYKNNMYALLNKPGYEDKYRQIKEDLSIL
ncbi:MAG: glucose-6-phosphate isomerase [Bacteroidales bacterium]|jgi:glucose-6-phosphate isomerase|nr:glucose-6-phosphate isomerase [Bacteroidales bacterium]